MEVALWRYLLVPALRPEALNPLSCRLPSKLDYGRRHVRIGPYTIQDNIVYGLPEDVQEGQVWRIVRLLAAVPGVHYEVEHTGVRHGYGHGFETLRFRNYDGSVIYEVRHVDHCEGTGTWCPYDHGPFYRYGRYSAAVSVAE